VKPDTTYAPIRGAGPEDDDAVLGVLAAAFRTDPLAAWLFPDPSERARLQDGFHRSLLGHPRAKTYLIGDGDGAAVWLFLGAGERLHGGGPDGPADAGLARLGAVGEALAARHPVDRPHLYLAVMGVAPERQGAGLGAALLRRRLDRADRDGIGAYLEAGSERSRALYLRHGFTDLGAPVRLADAPPIHPMWRPPAAPATTR
jgi:GNAT superfamily N-acetyltransferase